MISAGTWLKTVQRSVGQFADHLLTVQQFAVGSLVGLTVALILLNVITRAAGYAIFWIDELAIYVMIWAFMIGASATIRTRQGISITLLRDNLTTRIRRWLDLVLDSIVLFFCFTLITFNWIWFDPILLYSSGFDIPEFIKSSFNFIYREPTITLGISKVWVWLVMPIMAALATCHALANWFDRLVDIIPESTG